MTSNAYDKIRAHVASRNDQYKVVNDVVQAALADIVKEIDAELPKIQLMKGGKLPFFKMLDLEIPLDLTAIDSKGIGRMYQYISQFASHGADMAGLVRAEINGAEGAIESVKLASISSHTEGKKSKDLKPTLLTKIAAADDSVQILQQILTVYKNKLHIIEGRLQAYGERTTALSREIARRGADR